MTRILLIEDEADIRAHLRQLLQLENFDVAVAADGASGLADARATRPDLILCDVNMPGLNGYAVLEQLRADPSVAGTPFIFLTARATQAELRAGMNHGADDYLTKPISSEDLLAAIKARLARATLPQPARSNGLLPRSPKALEQFGLTRREAEVLHWLSQGKSNPDIAAILGLGLATVKTHVLHIFEKLGVENRSAAILRTLEIAEV